MVDHLQKRHDGSTSKKISNGSSDGIAAITNKLDSLGRDIKKLKENVNAIQVGHKTCKEAHLNKECLLHEEVKNVKEVKYREFRRSFPNNEGNKGRYRVGLPRYYTRVDNRPPFGKKKLSLEELINKHLEDSTRRRAYMELTYFFDVLSHLYLCSLVLRSNFLNLREIEQLAKDYQAKATNEVPNLCKISRKTDEGPSEVLSCQLPLKELSPRSFTLPYIIGSLNLYAMADLEASANIMPRSMFNHLRLTNLKETNMLVEMADMTKKAPMGIVENIMAKIDKFLLPLDFEIIDVLGDPNETMILGRPFLATIHARIYVFDREISLGFGDDKIIFEMNGNVHHPIALVEKACMINEIQEESFNLLEISDDLFSYDSPLCLEFENITTYMKLIKTTKKHVPIIMCKGNLEERKKGVHPGRHMGKCEQVYGGTMYSWHDEGSKEQWESSLDEKYYDPPQVCVETFKGITSLEAKRHEIRNNEALMPRHNYNVVATIGLRRSLIQDLYYLGETTA
nr:hypothetical protein [Tanacetum cinerariifolium]